MPASGRSAKESIGILDKRLIGSRNPEFAGGGLVCACRDVRWMKVSCEKIVGVDSAITYRSNVETEFGQQVAEGKKMKIIVYGIPTCGSCKKAITWLKDQGHEHEFVDLRKSPPSESQVKAWVASLGSKPLRNTSGGSYRALGEEKKGWDDQRWTKEFSNDPMLLKRPIFEVDGQFCVGFRTTDQMEAMMNS